MSDAKDRFVANMAKAILTGTDVAPTNAQEALYVLSEYFLGENFFYDHAIPAGYSNTILVDEILKKYRKEYKHDVRKALEWRRK